MYIKSVEMMNCQSLKHVKYQFSKGLNVIVGENSMGKSIFYKALKIAVGSNYIGVRDLRHFKSYGAKTCGCLFTLSDESTGGFVSDGKSIFYLYNRERYSEPNQTFVRKLGALVDTSSKFLLNLLDPDQDLLFVNSRESTNYSVLKMLSDCDSYEKFVDDLDEQLAVATDTYNKISRDLETTNAMMSVFSIEDIPTLEVKVDMLFNARDAMRVVVDLFEKVQLIACLDEGQLLVMSIEALYLDIALSLSKLQCISQDDLDIQSISVCFCEIALCMSKIRVNEKDIISLLDGQRLLLDVAKTLINVVPVRELEYEATLVQEALLNLATVVSKIQNIFSLKTYYTEFISSLPQLECPLYGTVVYFEEGCVSIE